jgi:undecaprenyl-diphosphatase
MSYLQALILGIIQGLTEFIPISSTAHLTIAGKLMGVIDAAHPERWTSFIAMVQLGTLLAVFIYFRKEIISIPKAFFKENFARIPFKKQSVDARLGAFIIAGSVPIGVIGLLAKDFIEGSFTKSLNVIGVSLIALAVLLFIAEKVAKFRKDTSQITLLDSLIVGFFQCLALIPGASRSGSTLTGGLFCGINRSDAARFSFLLGIPAILASGLLSFVEALEYVNTGDLANIIIAGLTSAISGYFAISFMLHFLKTRSTMLFIVYRIVLGALLLIFAGNLS